MTKVEIVEGVRFLHVPRTGGTSIRNAWSLRPPEIQGHDAYHSEPFAYGFCRNPWDRVVSLYHLVNNPSRHPNAMPFRDWILGGMPTQDYGNYDVRWPCWHWLRHARWVGRFERRDEDLRQLAEILGRPDPSGEHSGASDRGPYEEYYDDETRDFVGLIYRVDVEAYGYEFEGDR